MRPGEANSPSRLAVLAPSGRDAELLVQVLAGAAPEVRVCADDAALCAAIARGADAALIAEEALTPEAARRLEAVVRAQPPWSDVPLIVLGIPGSSGPVRLFESLSPWANATLLERPTRPFVLLAAVRAALRARQRQYVTRAHLEELVAARDEITHHRDELDEAVHERTEELRAAHERLRLTERMAAIGTLAAGVGHDLANLLLPIRVQVEALSRAPTPQAREEALAAVQSCIDHLQRLAGGLRQLALDPADVRGRAEGTDLAEWWPQAEPLLRNALPRAIELHHDLERARGVRLGVGTHQLTQAVFNLVQNAGEAMRARGSGCVRIAAAPGEPGWTVLTVSDDGPGMSEEVRRRCLEPLFTTKARQLSTGLGLSLVQGVVQRAGGRLEVSSVIGRGTTFTLAFPELDTARPQTPERVATVTVSEARTRGILIATLRTLGCTPEDGAGPSGQSLVWVVEAAAAAPGAVLAYLADRPERRVVVVGGSAPPVDDPRVRVATDVRPSAVRQALQLPASVVARREAEGVA